MPEHEGTAGMRLLAGAAILALALPLSACGGDDETTTGGVTTGGESTAEVPSYSTVESRIETGEGDRFSIAVRENPSVGDAWQFEEEGDPAVVRLVDDGWETDAEDPGIVGAGGTRTFTFEAVGPGRTEIVLFNCFRCQDGEPLVPPEEELDGPYAWDVTVE